jgi:hypothetical protein
MTEMADFSFTRADLDALTEKLGETATALTTQQWDLLLAIFAAAADHIKVDPADATSGTLPGAEITGNGAIIESPGESSADELRDQLLRAYTPGRRRHPRGFGESITPG